MDREAFFHTIRHRTAEEIEQIQIAYWLAKGAHQTQARDDGERYFDHPRRVAMNLVEYGYQETPTVIAGLLHDIVEDTYTPLQVIVNLFAPETWEWVRTLSRTIPTFDPISGQIIARAKKDTEDYYRAIKEADRRLRVVKLADRLDNLITCAPFSPQRKRRYVAETRTHVLPIARITCPRYTAAIEEQVRMIEAEFRVASPA